MRFVSRLLFREAAALCALISLIPAASTARPRPIIEALKARYASDKTLEILFDLEIFWKVREKTEKKSGTILLAPGDKFRVTLGTTVWVCDGQRYWQYSSATNQVVIKHLLDVDLSTHPSQIMQTYLGDYAYQVTQEDERRAVLAWKSDEPEKTPCRSLRLWVDKKNTAVTKLVVEDVSGNVSTYTITTTRTGVPVQGDTFTFSIPEGAQVLDTRE